MDIGEQTEIRIFRGSSIVIGGIIIGPQLRPDTEVIADGIFSASMKDAANGAVFDLFSGGGFFALGLIGSYIDAHVQEDVLFQKTLGIDSEGQSE